MRDFGTNLGIAYQIFDDCVDILGQERKAGKSLGTDMKKGKLTLPFLLLLRATGAENRPAVADKIFRNDPAEREQLLTLAAQHGAIRQSLTTIREYLARAESNLSVLQPSHYATAMASLAGYLGQQSETLIQDCITAQ